MAIKEQFKFYFTNFHTGFLNIGFHIISIPFIYYGFSEKNYSMIVLGFYLDGIGHAYNYFFKFNEVNKNKSIEIIPLVFILGFIFCVFLAKIFNWF